MYSKPSSSANETQGIVAPGETSPSWTVRYAYDYPGGVYTVTYPSGAVRRYELDALGRPDAVKDGGSAIADYVYTDTAGYATVAYGNGLTTRVEYDRLGRTTLITSPVGGYAYGYDAGDLRSPGNRLWMQRQYKTGQPYDVYEYDALYQLTQAWYGATTTDPQDIAQREYALDLGDLRSHGNRLWVQADGATATYTLKADGMNRYSQAATTTLSYDARGNVLNDGLRGYGYDPLNRMTGAGSATYLYDAFGRRVARTVGGATTFYVYDTQGRVQAVNYTAEEWRDGNWVSRYTYGAGITEISDASGNLVERYEYDVETGNYFYCALLLANAGASILSGLIGGPYVSPESSFSYSLSKYGWLDYRTVQALFRAHITRTAVRELPRTLVTTMIGNTPDFFSKETEP